MDVEEIVARAIATANGWSLPNDLTLPYAEGGRVGQTIAAARAALRALEEAGFAVVPREPTPEMIESGHLLDPFGCDVEPEDVALIYGKIWFGMVGAAQRAMLDAAGRDESLRRS